MEWTDLAVAFAGLKFKLSMHARRARGDTSRRAHLERIVGVNLAARTICKLLRSRMRRFDGRRFMRIAGGAAK
jgi:hypothetical protein